MPQPVLVRLAVLVCGAVATLTAGALVAPAAYADPPPPGLCDLPEASSASLYAVPLTDPFGRKLR